ncbi:MAG: alpha-ketoglutarate-dependent dioxygenase AlkB family protein, partial [Planctomycetota bacterium]
MEPVPLADGGLVQFDPHFLDNESAEATFSALRRGCAWEQKPGLFGRPQPRMIASYGDPGLTYRYSGVPNLPRHTAPAMLQLRDRIAAINGRYNFCLANLYRDGTDSMGWHADDEPEMGPIIASLTFGATRRFRIRHNNTREIHEFALGHGALLIMSGTMQQYWQHEIPKTRLSVGERINLTFREVLSSD